MAPAFHRLWEEKLHQNSATTIISVNLKKNSSEIAGLQQFRLISVEMVRRLCVSSCGVVETQ